MGTALVSEVLLTGLDSGRAPRCSRKVALFIGGFRFVPYSSLALARRLRFEAVCRGLRETVRASIGAWRGKGPSDARDPGRNTLGTGAPTRNVGPRVLTQIRQDWPDTTGSRQLIRKHGHRCTVSQSGSMLLRHLCKLRRRELWRSLVSPSSRERFDPSSSCASLSVTNLPSVCWQHRPTVKHQ